MSKYEKKNINIKRTEEIIEAEDILTYFSSLKLQKIEYSGYKNIHFIQFLLYFFYEIEKKLEFSNYAKKKAEVDKILYDNLEEVSKR